jgi:hypothetical protein
LIISSVIVPEKFAWMVGAVEVNEEAGSRERASPLNSRCQLRFERERDVLDRPTEDEASRLEDPAVRRDDPAVRDPVQCVRDAPSAEVEREAQAIARDEDLLGQTKINRG